MKKSLSDAFRKEALEEVCRMLDEEMKKNSSKRDYDKISELTEAYAFLTDTEDQIEQAAQNGMGKLLSDIQPEVQEYEPEETPVIMHTGAGWFRNIAAIAACLAVCAGTVGGVYALKRSPSPESVQTLEEISTETETQPQTEEIQSETKAPAPVTKHTDAVQVLSAVTAETHADETEIMTTAIETQIIPEVFTTAELTASVTSVPIITETQTETVIMTEPEESEFIPETEIIPEETIPETEAVIITAEEPQPIETEPVTETQPEPETEIPPETAEFSIPPEVIGEDGLPIIPGYQLTLTVNEHGYHQYTIVPVQKAADHAIVEQKYAPTWTPENLKAFSIHLPDGTQNTEWWMEDFPYHYSLFYKAPGTGQIEFSQSIPYYEAPCASLDYRTGYSGKSSGEDIEYVSQPLTFSPITISGRPGFIQTCDLSMYVTDPDTGEKRLFPDYKEYKIIWEQDGYLFDIDVNGAPEAYLGELLKMAESIQPIE